MVDRAKVLKGLQCLARTREPTSNPCADCGYVDRPNFAMCVVDIANDALDLLKQEEEVPVKRCRVHPNARYPFSCGNCGSYLMTTWIACPMCGRKVKWK